ncbi:MAG: adenylosuccinate lyase family protein [Acidihalobacter sp.]|uniref:class-II fumarase/aspartase family protein n=1 Tax=Acidihalobacter sp. TaxID=1872108 RepID=UPI00307FCF50
MHVISDSTGIPSMGHGHIVGQIADSQFFGNGYSTPETRWIFSDLRRLQRWLDVEVALAQTQSEIGMIPEEVGDILASTARIERLDLDAIGDDIASSGHSLVPLLRAWQKTLPPTAAQYVHFGATTQDIQDTAQSLEIAESLDLIERDLLAVVVELARLAEENRDTVTIGRSHGQHALPTTMGLKFAIWLDETLRNLERLRVCRRTVCVAQLFGGVGTMAAFGRFGVDLLERFAGRLGLRAPDVAWHTARDRVAEFLSTLALVSGGLANIGNEIVQLAKTDVGELAEPFELGNIGSSTMPHKRNPELSERVVVLARLVKQTASLGFEALCNEHERDYRAVRLEWVAIADAVLHTAAALELMKKILSGLVVNYERIAANVEEAAQNICSEALMFQLGSRLGKSAAYQVVYDAVFLGREANGSLVDRLLEDMRVAGHFDRDALIDTVTPANHLGSAGRLIEGVVKRARDVLTSASSVGADTLDAARAKA